jgi:WD40 repeat protein
LFKTGGFTQEFIGHSKSVNAVKFACQNTRIVSVSDDAYVCCWSIEDGCQLHSINSHMQAVTCLAMIGDTFCVSGSLDYSLILWELSPLTFRSIIKPEAVDYESIVFENNRVICRTGYSTKIWATNVDYEEAKFVNCLFECTASYLNLMVSGIKDGLVQVWNVTSKSNIMSFEGHTGCVRAVAIWKDVIAS